MKHRIVSLGLLTVCALLLVAPGWTETAIDAWSGATEILSRIKAPSFPERDFDLKTFGALGDGQADDSAAFRKAIEAAHKAGGGRVVVPAGTYRSGPIRLLSNVNLHVTEGATIRFSNDPAQYLPLVLTRFEGVELMNYSPLIYAFEQENIAVTGRGVLDGQADAEHWWPWKGGAAGQPSQGGDREALFASAEKGVPAVERLYGAGHYLRPSFFEPMKCRNVLLEGVTFKASPMWFLHPVLCSNVIIRGVTTIAHGPNTDGCNPESCRDVLIEDCTFDNGDDCIALKSGRNADGRRLATPIENVIIRRCRMKAGHGGITIGSEISGGARNIYAEDCTLSSPELDRGLRLKTNSVRGGTIENLFLRNIEIGEVREAAIMIDLYYEEGDQGPHVPTIRNIVVENMRSGKSRYALLLKGYEHAPIRDILLRDSAFAGVTHGNLVSGVTGLKLENVTLNGAPLGEEGLKPQAPWTVRVADSELKRRPDPLTIDTPGEPIWNYTQGFELQGFLALWERTHDQRYFDYAKKYYEAMISPDGTIRRYRLKEFNIDRVNAGKPLFILYAQTKDERYKKAMDTLREQMRRHPRTKAGGFWHKEIYPWQMWLDGLYMGAAYLAQYAAAFNEPALFDDVTKQLILMEKHSRDDKTGLLYHAWDESRKQRWCDPATGRSRHFWGRGVGWYAMALVDILDYLPESHPDRSQVIAILNRLAEAVVKVQDPFDGVWWQVLDMPNRQGNYQESTASCMFVYSLFKGVRKGYLDRKYFTPARKGWEGILRKFISIDKDGLVDINHACLGAGLGGDPYRDGSYEYYINERVGSNDPKVLAPFIMAGLEIEALEARRPARPPQ
jgi:unsaturated rhamnogalacturonyl hydrolase